MYVDTDFIVRINTDKNYDLANSEIQTLDFLNPQLLSTDIQTFVGLFFVVASGNSSLFKISLCHPHL